MKINSKEAAKLIGVSVGTLANMRYEGRGPKYKHDKTRIVYELRDVQQWIKKRGKNGL